MRNYASSAPFNWLREKLKISKPSALPWGQWEVWDDELKQSRPVAYFLTEALPDWLEKPAEWILDPIDNAIYYIRRRFIYRTHLLETNLKPGRYHDLDTRILHGLFNSLVEYVEQEKAWNCIRFEEPEHRKKYNVPWWVDNWYVRWAPWRCQRAGLDHLHWEMDLSGPGEENQSRDAQEVYILYLWWKEIRSKRNISEDAWEQCGLKDFYNRMDAKYGEGRWGIFSGKKLMTAAEQQEYSDLQEVNQKLEESWREEDDQMLERLIKIRRSLWS